MSESRSNREHELLLRVSRGDEQAFEQMIYLYSERVFFHALTFIKSWHQAEELVQDIFMRIWQKRDKLQQVENWDKYLFTVSRNFLINAVRRAGAKFELGEADDIPDLLTPDQQQENKELRILLDKAIQQLPDQKRAVFTMIHLEGESQEKVAQALGIATRTVRWNLVSAINEIRDFLHRHAVDPLPVILLLCLPAI
ncbi:RNA polymerase sigma factor [Chitinophaga sp. XS-30]|uniref:RNA polymerase sigma factor n=1 Tax=Chitinophaga sp. XS-30 TaxID=2604421 RepID=UPI0011DCE722|nr:sigma-70 family RNA polymerase sigma factor [Chitinophaga sp. XS-30]QEH42871.1 sigma-70 family RNA polymerase sigma factor [Chitinophaga sp. XS-30]